MQTYTTQTKQEIKATTGMTSEGARQALIELISGFGYYWADISTNDLQLVADKLSEIADRPADKFWGWRYLRNVLNKKIEASGEMVKAIFALGATIDGLPEILASAQPVTVMATKPVQKGALILRASQPCARPGCTIHFVPVSGGQKYCTPTCRAKDYKRTREIKRNGKANGQAVSREARK